MPLASLDYGLLDMLIVKKISRAKFISMVGDYRAGTYINRDTQEIKDKFRGILTHVRCRNVTVTGMDTICADGEIEKTERIEIEISPKAITYIG